MRNVDSVERTQSAVARFTQKPLVFSALPKLPLGSAHLGLVVGLPSRLRSGRLASLAAAICSGVLTSGSDSLIFIFARETCRLCRFASLLSIPLTLHPLGPLVWAIGQRTNAYASSTASDVPPEAIAESPPAWISSGCFCECGIVPTAI